MVGGGLGSTRELELTKERLIAFNLRNKIISHFAQRICHARKGRRGGGWFGGRFEELSFMSFAAEFRVS